MKKYSYHVLYGMSMVTESVHQVMKHSIDERNNKMILNVKGDIFKVGETKYVVGDEIAAAKTSPYYGFIGVITEIRTGKDRETDNETVDIYCTFDQPAILRDRELLTERFSKLYGYPIVLDEINLEQVIMAPDMIMPLTEQHGDTVIYILTEEWCSNDGFGCDVFVFTNPEKVRVKIQQLVRYEKNEGYVSEWMDEYDFIEESTEDGYSCWRDNDHDGYHYHLHIDAKEIDVSDWR